MKKYSLLVIFLLIVCAYVSWRFFTRESSIKAYAQSILSQCESSPYRPACYEKEIPKAAVALGMEAGFAITSEVQDLDREFLYCHTTAHRLSLDEVKKNPSDWKSVLLRCPFAVCNYGCQHGALIAKFREEHLSDEQIEEVVPEIQDICEARDGFDPTRIDRTMCYHGMGHLAMYMTGGRPDKSIGICERVSRRSDGQDFTQTCVEGVFMTIFQSIDPEDKALVIDIIPPKHDVAAFCATYGVHWKSCRRESIGLFWDEIYEPEGLLRFCEYAQDDESAKNCYVAVVNTITTTMLAKPDGLSTIASYCAGIPSATRKWCFSGAATRLVQIDPMRYVNQANAICSAVSDSADKEYCYADLLFYATFTYASKSRDFITYCSALDEPYRHRCLEAYP